MIILFVLFILFIGFFISHVFSKTKIIELKNYCISEIISFSFIIGVIFLIVYLILYGLKFSYSFYMYIPLIPISIFGLVLLILDIKRKNYLVLEKANKKRRIINLIINILLGITFVILSILALKSNLNTPDEFSLWGRQAKAIYNMKGYLKLNESVGISYPLSMPLFYSSFYFFSGVESCNEIRLISTIFLFFFSIMFIGRSKRMNYNDCMARFVLLIFISMNTITREISTTLYVDILIMLLYSMGFLYICDYLSSRKKDNIILYIIFNSFVCCIKPDGFYLSIISTATIILFLLIKKIFYNKRIKKFDIIIGIISFISSGLCYFIYRFIYKLLSHNSLRYVAPSAYEPQRFKLDILNQAIDNGAKQMFLDYSIVSIVLLLFVLIFLLIKNKKKIDNNNMSRILLCTMCFVFNLMFLYLAFIYQFGGEGVLAPSIIRYMTRVTPLIFEIILILFMNLEELNNEKDTSINVYL